MIRLHGKILLAIAALACVVLVVSLCGLTAAQAEIRTLTIVADRDIFKDASGLYNSWDSKLYIGQFFSPYYHSKIALGFNLADVQLEDLPIISINLVMYRASCTGLFEMVVTETQDDNWTNSSSSAFPSLVDAREVFRVNIGQSGLFVSQDLQDYILDNYYAGDRYLTLLLTTDSTTQNASIYSLEFAGSRPRLEVRYGYPAATIKAAASLAEDTIAATDINLELTDCSFTTGALTPAMFAVDDTAAANGITVDQVTYVDATHATLRLSAAGDPDQDLSISVLISGDVLDSGDTLTTNALGFHAYYEIPQPGVYDLAAMGDKADVIVTTTGPVILTQSTQEAVQRVRIECLVSGVEMTLSGVNWDNSPSWCSAYQGITFMGAGNTLTLAGENTLKTYDRPAICVPVDTQLTLQGAGTLHARTERFAATIGAPKERRLGDVVINSGTYDLSNGMSGACIGGSSYGSYGTVTINGGTFDLHSSSSAACIGTGEHGVMGSITINGGTITANAGGHVAAIGCGGSGVVSEAINITGGRITAYGGSWAAAIGTAWFGHVQAIHISGGTINAYGDVGPAIGAGDGAHVGTITISGGTVVTRSDDQYAAAIGMGVEDSVCDAINITGGMVFAAGGKISGVDDIGYGKYADPNADCQVSITGNAVVFLRNNEVADREDDITVPFHSGEAVVDGQAYGYTLPDNWGSVAYAYFPDSNPVTGVYLPAYALQLNINQSQSADLAATVEPAQADNQGVRYTSSNPAVATVDAAGLVQSKSTGTTTITVTTDDGGFTDTCLITVFSGVSSVSISPKAHTLYLGDADPANDSVQLSADVLPGDADNQVVYYQSADTSVASVTTNGLVTAVGRGTVMVTVTTLDGGYTDTCEIKVCQCVSGVAVSPDAAILVLGDADTTNDGVSLYAAVTPSDATDTTVLWTSSNPDAATVTASGRVSAKAAGSTTITATTQDGGFTAEALVTVKQAATDVSLDVHEAILVLGTGDPADAAITLSAILQPPDATEVGLIWESDNTTAATVDNSGNVTGLNYGTAQITVTTADGLHSDSCAVKVYQAATGIAVAPTSAALTLGDASTANDAVTLQATVQPATAYQQVTWHSDTPDVASVDSGGLVTAHQAGDAVLTATSVQGGFSASCAVRVIQAVTSVILSQTSAVLVLDDGDPGNDTLTLGVTVGPEDASDKTLTFTSTNSAVASVDAYGVITAHKAGVATIQVSTANGGPMAACAVTVAQRVTGVSLASASATLVLDDADTTNDTVSLTATVAPADADNRAVTYSSSDPAVASVDAGGTVTAESAGSAEITVTTVDGGFTAVCTVTVQQRVTGLTIAPSAALLAIGDEDTENDAITLTANILPADADNQAIVWTSDAPAVATVDAAGVVTAVGKGKATITATTADGGFAAASVITVERRLMLHTGGHCGRVCLGNCITIAPSLGGGTWTYDPALVSRQGNTFTPIKAGTTVVTYTLDDKGKSDTLLQRIFALLFSAASAENIESASFTITTEPLTLTSSLASGMADLHESFTLTPNFAGGTWSFDENVLRQNGSYFATKTTAKTTITYTYEGQTASYTLEVFNLSPQTGDERPPLSRYALLAALAAGAGLYLRGLRRRRA